MNMDFDNLSAAIRDVLDDPHYDDGSLAPIIIRLAWHAAATYDKYTGTGGTNGSTMRLKPESTDEGNAGLEYARWALEPIKRQFPWISYADLWTFAAVVALKCLGGPDVEWKPGRVDVTDPAKVPPNGRLPFGGLGANHVRDVFSRLGFDERETVALIGAHNIGRTHASRSGFDGAWVPNPVAFGNEFYQLLLNEEWREGPSPTGRPQFYNCSKTLMMMPTDMSLVSDPKYRRWVEVYAKDKNQFYKDFAAAFAKLLELGVPR